MQGWFNILKKLTNVMLTSKRDKNPNNHLSRNRKALDKNPIPFHDKNTQPNNSITQFYYQGFRTA